MSRIVQTVSKAWLAEWSDIGPAELAELKDATRLHFCNHDMTSSGWTYIGTATISVEVITDTETLVANKVEALRGEVQKIRAEAQVKASRLEDQIQQLLAITYTPTEEAA
jgi:hypothetical protein